MRDPALGKPILQPNIFQLFSRTVGTFELFPVFFPTGYKVGRHLPFIIQHRRTLQIANREAYFLFAGAVGFEVVPEAVAVGVRVDADVQVVSARFGADRHVQVPTLEVGIEE